MNRDFEVRELVWFELAHVATRGNPATAAAALSSCLGVDIGPQPNAVAERADGLVVLWFGPGRWLVHAPEPGGVPQAVDGCVVTDLSDSRRILRLAGLGVCDYLTQSCPLDLDESAMPPGSVALTQFDRFSVLLHRRDAETFDLYVERSYADALPGGLVQELRP